MNYNEYKKALAMCMEGKDNAELRREIATRYEKYLRDNNLTVVEATEHFGISYATYYKLMKGKPLQIEVLCKLTALL
jgi:predicted transcriptional regulator